MNSVEKLPTIYLTTDGHEVSQRLVVLLCINCVAFFTSLSPTMSTALSNPGGKYSRDSRTKINAHVYSTKFK